MTSEETSESIREKRALALYSRGRRKRTLKFRSTLAAPLPWRHGLGFAHHRFWRVWRMVFRNVLASSFLILIRAIHVIGVYGFQRLTHDFLYRSSLQRRVG